MLAYCGAVVLVALTIVNCYRAGGPYLQAPRTVLDHVYEGKHPQRNVLIAVPQFVYWIPPRAQVTCFRPQNGTSWNDDASYFTAVLLLPHNDVVPPLTAAPELPHDELAEYVIAVDAPFSHPAYDEIAAVPNGWLYRRR